MLAEHDRRRADAFIKFERVLSTLKGVEIIIRDNDGFSLGVTAPNIVSLLSYIDQVKEKVEETGFSCLDQDINAASLNAKLAFTFNA